MADVPPQWCCGAVLSANQVALTTHNHEMPRSSQYQGSLSNSGRHFGLLEPIPPGLRPVFMIDERHAVWRARAQMECQARFGGFRKVPGNFPDPLHSCLSLCALSLLGEPGLLPLGACWGVPAWPPRRRRAAAAAPPPRRHKGTGSMATTAARACTLIGLALARAGCRAAAALPQTRRSPSADAQPHAPAPTASGSASSAPRRPASSAAAPQRPSAALAWLAGLRVPSAAIPGALVR